MTTGPDVAVPSVVKMSHSELVERWVYVRRNERNGMERFTSAVVHSSADPRRVKSAQNTKRDFQQPVESLTVSFSKLLVDHTEQHSPKKKKKRPASSKSVRNNRPVTQVQTQSSPSSVLNSFS